MLIVLGAAYLLFHFFGKDSTSSTYQHLVGKPIPYELYDELGEPKTLEGTDNDKWVVYFDQADITIITEKKRDIVVEVLNGKQPQEIGEQFKYKGKTDDNYEYNEQYRIDAYNNAKVFIQNEIEQDVDMRCEKFLFGKYNSQLIFYEGRKSYHIQVYCNYTCQEKYRHKRLFTLRGQHSERGWSYALLKQSDVY